MTHYSFGGSGSSRKTPSAALADHVMFSSSSPPWTQTLSMGTVVNSNDMLLLVVRALAATSGTPTIGGHACSLIGSQGSGDFEMWLLGSAAVAALGSTASVALNDSGAGNGGSCALYRVANADPTPVDVQGATGSTSTSFNLTATGPKQLPILCAGAFQVSVAESLSFNLATQDYNEQDSFQDIAQAGCRGALRGAAGAFSCVTTGSSGSHNLWSLGVLFQGHL